MVIAYHTVITGPAVGRFGLSLYVTGCAVTVEVERSLFKDLGCCLIVILWTKYGFFMGIERQLCVVDVKIWVLMNISLFCLSCRLDTWVTALDNPH